MAGDIRRKSNSAAKPELIRAFVAVPVGEAAAREIERLLLRLSPMANLKWATRMQLHITLKFLGEHTREEIEQVKTALAVVKAEWLGTSSETDAIRLEIPNQFTITLGKVGGFPNISRPNVLWLGATEGTRELTALADRVEDALAAVGFPRERKSFQPHLTLARAYGDQLPERLVKALVDVPVFSWQCSDFCLMRSRLTPRGAIYSPIPF